jgi:hypothetical protein
MQAANDRPSGVPEEAKSVKVDPNIHDVKGA